MLNIFREIDFGGGMESPSYMIGYCFPSLLLDEEMQVPLSIKCGQVILIMSTGSLRSSIIFTNNSFPTIEEGKVRAIPLDKVLC